MNKHARRLEQIISDVQPRSEVILSPLQERVFRMLKTTGERAVKGREISSTIFEAKGKATGVALLLVMEGRHAMSVGHQVARRFEDMRELEFVKVKKTGGGALVVLRVKEEQNA
jgi:hypothetical protein